MALGLLAAPSGCKRDAPSVETPPSDTGQTDAQIDARTDVTNGATPSNQAITALRPSVCPSQRGGGLKVPRGHHASTVAKWDGLRSLQPHVHEHPPLGARAHGLLSSIAYYSGDDCLQVPAEVRDEYVFSSSAGSYYALYFPSTGGGFNFLRDWQVPLPEGGVARYDAAMLRQRDAAPCLSACAHFVELDVNDGRGGLGLHFVATGYQVVDDQHGFDPARVLEDLRRRFAGTLGTQHGELRRLYEEGERVESKIQLERRTDGPVQLFPSWSADDATLEVLAWSTGSATGSRKLGSETIAPTKCPPGAPCAYRETGTFELYEELTVSHELAAFYRVDDSGTLLEERIYAPRVQTSLGQSRRRV